MAAVSPRKRRGGLGQPAWLITFADLMTLLLTFFILLLSFSEIDAEKYRAMLQSMTQAFGNSGAAAMAPGDAVIRVEVPALAVTGTGADATPVPTLLPAIGAGEMVQPRRVDPGIEGLAASLIQQLEAEVAAERLSVSYDQRRVVVRFAEDATFPSGTARMKPAIKPIIDEIVTALGHCSGDVIVSGHSDDQPIVSSLYRSNWDLSSARAVSLVHQLVLDQRLDAGRVMAAGHAETRPLVPNTSSANRARNRRVEISIYEPRCDIVLADRREAGMDQ